MPRITEEHPVQIGATITNGSSALRITERVEHDRRWGCPSWLGMCIPLEAFGGNAGMSDTVPDYLIGKDPLAGGWHHVPFEWSPVVGGGLEERYVWADNWRRLQREVRPVQPVHLRNGASYTGAECRGAWDSELYPEGPTELVTDLEAVTCRACKAHMVAEGQCSACGAYRLVWSAGPVKLSPISDGQLTMRDVETQFYLGCEECSETLIHSVSADEVAQALTARRWRPAAKG
jgi:hypothetical protein